MDQQADARWLTWTERLQAIGPDRVTFTREQFDRILQLRFTSPVPRGFLSPRHYLEEPPSVVAHL